jgi:hypothetical protein
MLHYCRSWAFVYIRILELEGVKKRSLTAALDKIGGDFKDLDGVIIDIRNNLGGDDSTAITIAELFKRCSGSRGEVAFYGPMVGRCSGTYHQRGCHLCRYSR